VLQRNKKHYIRNKKAGKCGTVTTTDSSTKKSMAVSITGQEATRKDPIANAPWISFVKLA
jgi:hypothetical protein